MGKMLRLWKKLEKLGRINVINEQLIVEAQQAAREIRGWEDLAAYWEQQGQSDSPGENNIPGELEDRYIRYGSLLTRTCIEIGDMLLATAKRVEEAEKEVQELGDKKERLRLVLTSAGAVLKELDDTPIALQTVSSLAMEKLRAEAAVYLSIEQAEDEGQEGE
jgi:hypothetical protein